MSGHSVKAFPSRHKSGHYRFIANVVRPLLNLLGRKRWQGVENLPEKEGFIVAANHLSNLDPLVVAHLLYNNGAPARIMAKAELWDLPVVGTAMRNSQMIPVKRGTRSAGDSLLAATEALEHGEAVLIYPEGTHSKAPGEWPMVARTGVARLALATGAPVIPVAQWGASKVMPSGPPYFRPWAQPTFQILVGPPVKLDDLHGRSDHEALTEATARIMRAITLQLAQIRGEQPPDTPWDMRKDGPPAPPGGRKNGGRKNGGGKNDGGKNDGGARRRRHADSKDSGTKGAQS